MSNKRLTAGIILADFRNLCRYTREHENFKPIPKSLLTKSWATTDIDEVYRNILLEALKYYFTEKDFRRILREEIKLDEEAQQCYIEAKQLQLESAKAVPSEEKEAQPESAKVEAVENVKECQISNCNALTTLL